MAVLLPLLARGGEQKGSRCLRERWHLGQCSTRAGGWWWRRVLGRPTVLISCIGGGGWAQASTGRLISRLDAEGWPLPPQAPSPMNSESWLRFWSKDFIDDISSAAVSQRRLYR